MGSTKFNLIRSLGIEEPGVELDEYGFPVKTEENTELTPEEKYDAEQARIAAGRPELVEVTKKFGTKQFSGRTRSPVKHDDNAPPLVDTDKLAQEEEAKTRPLSVKINGKPPEPNKPPEYEVTKNPDSGQPGDKQSIATPDRGPPPNDQNPYKFSSGSEYVEDLKKRMADYESASKLSGRRNLALGMTAGSMNIPENGRQFRESFKDYADYPVNSIKTGLDVNSKHLANDKAEFDNLDRVQLADPKSEVSKAWRNQVDLILKNPPDKRIPDTVSGLDLQKIFPTIKLDVIETGMTDRTGKKITSNEKIAADKLAAENQRFSEKLKADREALEKRLAGNITVANINAQGARDRAIISGSLAQKESETIGGPGGGGNGSRATLASTYTKIPIKKLRDAGYIGLVPMRDDVLPDANQIKKVDLANHWQAQLDTAFEEFKKASNDLERPDLTDEDYANIKSSLMLALQVLVKQQENGVMNGRDLDNAKAQVLGMESDPAGFISWVRGQFQDVVSQSWARSAKIYLSIIDGAGYKLTTDEDEMKKWFAKTPSAAGAGGSGGGSGARTSHSGPVNRGDPETLKRLGIAPGPAIEAKKPNETPAQKPVSGGKRKFKLVIDADGKRRMVPE